MARDTNKVWFITGCSTGFGRVLAEKVAQAGYRAVITARDASGLSDLVGERVRAASLDVTDASQIDAAVRVAADAFGRIDVLVNNAGYGYMAAIEEGEEAQVRRMFDTNVFGLVRLTQAVLPGMRARRAGHVINLSSQAGLVAFPGSGFYSASKHAVEAISESLSKEAGPLGIKVTLIEPGPFRTDFAGRSLHVADRPIDDYAETVGARRKQMSAYSGKQPGDPAKAAEAIIHVAENPNPPLRLALGKPAYDGIRAKLRGVIEELESNEAIALGADYPEGH